MDVVTALDVCAKSVYPVINRLLQSLAMQLSPLLQQSEVFLCLRRMKQWMRSTMSHERLPGQASMAISKNILWPEDAEKAHNKFAQKKKEGFSQSNMRPPVPTKLNFPFPYNGFFSSQICNGGKSYEHYGLKLVRPNRFHILRKTTLVSFFI